VHLRVEEAGDLGDPAGAQAEHVDRPEPEPLGARLVQVAGEAELPVHLQRDQAPRGGEHPFGEEPADVLAAVEPGGQRRHREPGVLGQEIQQRRQVGALPGGHQGLHQLAPAIGAEGVQLGSLGRVRHPLHDRLPGALQRAVHGGRGRVEDARDLGGGELQHLTQDQNRPLGAREVLQRRDEGQLDAFPAQVARLRIAAAGLVVHPRLEPDGAGHRLAEIVGVPPRRSVVGRQHPARPPGDQPQTGVGADAVQPGARGAAALEPGQAAPRAQQRLLQRILGVLPGPEHPVAVRVQLGPVARDEPLEGRFLSCGRQDRARAARSRCRCPRPRPPCPGDRGPRRSPAGCRSAAR
jgi:hypothetical protein